MEGDYKEVTTVKSVWIDTNIIIYYLRENQEFTPRVKALLQDAEQGEITLKISPLVIAECVFVLMGPSFRAKKEDIKEVLKSFINLKGINMEEKNVIEETLENFAKKGIDFTDAYIAAHARSIKPAHIITENIRDFRGLNVFAEVMQKQPESKS